MSAVKHQPATPRPTTEAKLRDVAHYLDGIGTAFAEDSAAAIDAAIKERRKLVEALRMLMDDTRATYDACKGGTPLISIGQFRRVNDALLLLVELGEAS